MIMTMYTVLFKITSMKETRVLWKVISELGWILYTILKHKEYHSGGHLWEIIGSKW